LAYARRPCTLVAAYVPQDKLCFGAHAVLHFHQARHADGRPALDSTQWMINRYPDDIQSWIVVKGGLEKVPYEGSWSLPASELWKMGYRKCSD